MSVEVANQPEPEAASVATRPPRALVVWEPPPEEIGAVIDWSRWYLTDEEDMGEGAEQGLLITILKSILQVLAVERRWRRVYIGSDQFFAWREDQPLVRVSPDVYLLDDPPPRPLPSMWQTWRPGHRPPRLAVEIVSSDRWRKDYDDNPPKYAQLGTRELVVFDPEAATGVTRAPARIALQVFRREPDGAFVRMYAGGGPVRSEEIDAWWVFVREGEAATLRVARDSAGRDLVPTEDEAREAAEQAHAEEARGRAEEARGRAEAERRVAELEAENERLRGK